MRVGVEILWGVKLKAEQMHRDWCRQNTVTESQTSNAGRSGRKVTLENLFRLPQRQSQRGDSSWSRDSANTLDDLKPQNLQQNVTALPSYLFIFQGFCFCSYQKGGKRFLFSGTTLMRPSHRFHGDSHKTVKLPVFQKKKNKKRKSLAGWRVVVGVGAVLQLSEGGFQRVCHSFRKVKPSL